MSEGFTKLKLILDNIDLNEVKQSIRQGILEKLAAADSPNAAFKVKLELDAMDAFFLWIEGKIQQNEENHLN